MSYNIVATEMGIDGKTIEVPPTMKGKKGIKAVTVDEYNKNPEEFIIISSVDRDKAPKDMEENSK